MTSYKILIFAFISTYFFIGILLGAVDYPNEEIFPFFSWSLYSKVPNNVKKYTLRITEYRNQKIEPVLFAQAFGRVINPTSTHAERIIQDMGKSFHNNPARFKIEQKLIDNYLLKTTRYELIMIEYEPLQKYKYGTEKITTINEFSREIE